ncbi:hypothetical protein G6R29_05230 [Fructobacillus sp. M2-14]|uniref:Uncharacterized protein n=1 Tax=Fructobacillus broussonetiae TaxID=2713173 RepID=A0ABS5R1C5_9LACO|nr:hypothetical protein [Fructobacillus broussonetiae]MBS9339022.1 hypothetical protein [Fructobacillus broussonetiae]
MSSYIIKEKMNSLSLKRNPFFLHKEGILFDVVHDGKMNIQSGDFIIFLDNEIDKSEKWFCKLVFQVAELLPWTYINPVDSNKSEYYVPYALDSFKPSHKSYLTTLLSTSNAKTFRPYASQSGKNMELLEVSGILSLFPKIKAWMNEKNQNQPALEIEDRQMMSQIVKMISIKAKNYGRVALHSEIRELNQNS